MNKFQLAVGFALLAIAASHFPDELLDDISASRPCKITPCKSICETSTTPFAPIRMHTPFGPIKINDPSRVCRPDHTCYLRNIECIKMIAKQESRARASKPRAPRKAVPGQAAKSKKSPLRIPTASFKRRATALPAAATIATATEASTAAEPTDAPTKVATAAALKNATTGTFSAAVSPSNAAAGPASTTTASVNATPAPETVGFDTITEPTDALTKGATAAMADPFGTTGAHANATSAPASSEPTPLPSAAPTEQPTPVPSTTPTEVPTTLPPTTDDPSFAPTRTPTEQPTSVPSATPTERPTYLPSATPTEAPTTLPPTDDPSFAPTHDPTQEPTPLPSIAPTEPPTHVPSATPTEAPTALTLFALTTSPTEQPTSLPSATPTEQPTRVPTSPPTPKSGGCTDQGITTAGKTWSCAELVTRADLVGEKVPFPEATGPYCQNTKFRAACPKMCRSCEGAVCEDPPVTGMWWKAQRKRASCSEMAAYCWHPPIRTACPKTCKACPGTCQDAPGKGSGITLDGKPASCSEMAAGTYNCAYGKWRTRVRLACPKSCGVCQTQSPTFNPTAALTTIPTFVPTTVKDYSSLVPTVLPSVSWFVQWGVEGDCWDTRRHEAQNWEECATAYKLASGSMYSGTKKSIESKGTRDDGEPSRCFYDWAKQELVFNNRSTAAPGTSKKRKLCGTRIKMAQLQITGCKQAVTNPYFSDKVLSKGWPVLADDWKSMFPDYRNTKGHKMWMTAADGSRRYGPVGARCVSGWCVSGNFVGKVMTSQGATCTLGRMGTDEEPKDFGWHTQRGAAWNDRMPSDEMCYKHGGRSEQTGMEDCWKSNTSFPHGTCPREEEWVNNTFHNGFRILHANGTPLTAAEVRAVNKGGAMPTGAVSCSRFYAPRLRLLNLELGLSPDANVPSGWVQYPLERSEDGKFPSNFWYKWTRSIEQVRRGQPGRYGTYDSKHDLPYFFMGPGTGDMTGKKRPVMSIAGLYKAGDFMMAEEVHHARECHAPVLDSFYGVPSWKDLSHQAPVVYQGKRFKFVKAHLDLDKIIDYGWCELGADKESDRCAVDADWNLINAGAVLSFLGCERKENKNGSGTARLEDAPMLYLDAVNDAFCSCTYPRCFAGTMVSEYEFTNANGQGVSLNGVLQAGTQKFEIKQTQLFPAIEKQLKKCCESRTNLFMRYAEEHCGEEQLEDVCAKAPNGYEARFEDEGLGADKHFPKSPCIAGAWSKFSLLGGADKRRFAQDQARKALCIDDNEGVKERSQGKAQDCTAVSGHCKNSQIGEMVRKYCPKTCGVCARTALPTKTTTDEELDLGDLIAGKQTAELGWAKEATGTGLQHEDVELDDAISGKQDARIGWAGETPAPSSDRASGWITPTPTASSSSGATPTPTAPPVLEKAQAGFDSSCIF